MARDMITQDRIARLIAMPRGESPYVTVYFRAWGSLAERRASLKNLIREGEAQIETDTGWSDGRKKEARALLEQARATCEGLVETTPVHGRGSHALFLGHDQPAEQLHLPLDVRDRIVVDRSPYASPLSSLIDQFERYGVLLCDQKRAKLFEVHLGQVEGWEELVQEDEYEREARGGYGASRKRSGSAAGGVQGLDELRRRNHAQFVLHQHLGTVADRAFRRFRLRSFDRLILGGPRELLPQLEEHLHSYLRQRVVAREELAVDLTPDQARKAVAPVEQRVEAEKERELLAEIQDGLGSSGMATAGLDETLRSLFFGKVRTLVVVDGEAQPGRECPECSFLFVRPQDEQERTPTLVECPLCKRPTRRVPDVIDEAIELAILSGARVEHVMYAQDELRALGGVAAVLRFK